MNLFVRRPELVDVGLVDGGPRQLNLVPSAEASHVEALLLETSMRFHRPDQSGLDM